jgi:RND family efflux transporter MFP subunit
MKKFLFPSILLIALLAFLAACGTKSHEPEKAEAAAPVPVQVTGVTPVERPVMYEAIGTVRARTLASISSKVMGYVREVKVQVGDRVAQGQLLASLDSRDLDARQRRAEAGLSEAKNAVPEVEGATAAAKANLELAQVTFNRMKDLFDKKSNSNQEFDEASTKLKAAHANYEMALSKRKQLDSRISQAEEALKGASIMREYAEITAPFAGRVTEKRVEPGDLATPGAPLLSLEREGAYRLEASVEESRLSQIRVGQKVSVVLDALGRTEEARVSEIVPAVDAASRAYTVKIDLPSLPNLRSGMFGRAIFPLGTRSVLVIPAGAVIEHGQLRSVLVAEDGAARTRLVTLGETDQGQSEVLSGLNPGDKIIFPMSPGLSDGAKVEVRP